MGCALVVYYRCTAYACFDVIVLVIALLLLVYLDHRDSDSSYVTNRHLYDNVCHPL